MYKENRMLMNGDIPIAYIQEDFSLKYLSNFQQISNFEEFIEDRIPSRDRRDIEKLLFKWKINTYDIYEIALKTRLVNPMDKYWIRFNEEERYADILETVLKQNKTIYSPSGNNIKKYYWNNEKFGIAKKRLSPVITDTESEVACYRLAKILKVPCCPVEFLDEDWTFSEYLYNFNMHTFRHVRTDMANYTGELFEDLIRTYPDLKEDIYKMVLFDFVTRQDDRHRSNIAIIYTGMNNRYFYPLYDNGRSLFFEDTEKMIEEAVSNIELYTTSFGEVGTYLDVVKQIVNPSQYINLDVSKEEIESCFNGLALPEYKKEGCISWIHQCLEFLKKINS